MRPSRPLAEAGEFEAARVCVALTLLLIVLEVPLALMTIVILAVHGPEYQAEVMAPVGLFLVLLVPLAVLRFAYTVSCLRPGSSRQRYYVFAVYLMAMWTLVAMQLAMAFYFIYNKSQYPREYGLLSVLPSLLLSTWFFSFARHVIYCCGSVIFVTVYASEATKDVRVAVLIFGPLYIALAAASHWVHELLRKKGDMEAARYFSCFNGSHEPQILVDDQLHIIDVNEAFLAMTDYELHGVRGMPVTDLFVSGERGRIVEGLHWMQHSEQIREEMERATSQVFQRRRRNRRNQVAPVDEEEDPDLPPLVSPVSAARATLDAARERVRRAGSELGIELNSLATARTLATYRGDFARWGLNDHTDFESLLLLRDQEREPVPVTVFMDHHSHHSVWTGVLTVNDRRGIERQDEKMKILRVAEQNALAADQAKSIWVFSISHELRTPLNAIYGMTQVLEGGKLDAEQKESMSVISTATQSLLRLVNDLLDYGKLESGNLETECIELDVREQVEGALSFVSPFLTAKGLDLTVNIANTIPAVLYGDPTRIRQILLNVLSNAVKFTDQGFIAVEVTGWVDQKGVWAVHVTIRDTGRGIPPEGMKRMFKTYSQADPTIQRTHGGTGLGLAICQSFAELMGGRMGVESEEGQGSVFFIDIPLPSFPKNSEAREISAPVPYFWVSERVSVMLAMPPGQLRKSLHDSLSTWNFLVYEVDSANAGLTVLAMPPSARPSGMPGDIQMLIIDWGEGELANWVESEYATSPHRVAMLIVRKPQPQRSPANNLVSGSMTARRFPPVPPTARLSSSARGGNGWIPPATTRRVSSTVRKLSPLAEMRGETAPQKPLTKTSSYPARPPPATPTGPPTHLFSTPARTGGTPRPQPLALAAPASKPPLPPPPAPAPTPAQGPAAFERGHLMLPAPLTGAQPRPRPPSPIGAAGNGQVMFNVPRERRVVVVNKPVSQGKLFTTICQCLDLTPCGVARNGATAPAGEATARHDTTTTTSSGPSIVVCDDQDMNLKVTEKLLHAVGYPNVVCVRGGLLAVKHAETRVADMYIIDCEMPDLNGKETLKQIRDIEKRLGRHRAPALMITGHDRATIIDEAVLAGFDDVLTKPIPKDALKALVEKTIVRRPEPPLVLVVDSLVLQRKVAVTTLRQFGYASHCVENGQEAVELWQPGKYCAILMDVDLPVMDGIEATARIRQAEDRLDVAEDQHVPILCVTSNTDPEARERALDVGMNDIIMKPYPIVKLKESLVKFVDPKRLPLTAPLPSHMDPQVGKTPRPRQDGSEANAALGVTIGEKIDFWTSITRPVSEVETARLPFLQMRRRNESVDVYRSEPPGSNFLAPFQQLSSLPAN